MATPAKPVTTTNKAVIEMFDYAKSRGWSRKRLQLEMGCTQNSLLNLATGKCRSIKMITAKRIAALPCCSYTVIEVYRMSNPPFSHPCKPLVALLDKYGNCAALAKVMGAHRTTISGIIKNRLNIGFSTAIKLSKLTKLSISCFLYPYSEPEQDGIDNEYVSSLIVSEYKTNTEALSKQFGLSTTTILRMAHGKRLNIKSAKKIVRKYSEDGITLGELATARDQTTKKWRRENET